MSRELTQEQQVRERFEAFQRDLFVKGKQEEIKNLLLLRDTAYKVIASDTGVTLIYNDEIAEEIDRIRSELFEYITKYYKDLMFKGGCV